MRFFFASFILSFTIFLHLNAKAYPLLNKNTVFENPTYYETIKLPVKALHSGLLKWFTPHEFLYKGEMYDVIKKELRGNEVWLYCKKDFKERALIEKWISTIEDESGKNPFSFSSSKTIKFCEILNNINILYYLPGAINPKAYLQKPYSHTLLPDLLPPQ